VVLSPASSTTKTGRHDIAEILLKVALNTKNQKSLIFGGVTLTSNNILFRSCHVTIPSSLTIQSYAKQLNM
jgi:hypothetical protein